jgi:hypothetical protein
VFQQLNKELKKNKMNRVVMNVKMCNKLFIEFLLTSHKLYLHPHIQIYSNAIRGHRWPLYHSCTNVIQTQSCAIACPINGTSSPTIARDMHERTHKLFFGHTREWRKPKKQLSYLTYCASYHCVTPYCFKTQAQWLHFTVKHTRNSAFRLHSLHSI